MATTGTRFVVNTNAVLEGSTVAAAGAVGNYLPSAAASLVVTPTAGAAAAAYIDQATGLDFATDALAKHGAASIALSGTTPVTISLADLTSNTASNTGDTAFATVSTLVITNGTAGAITVAPGGSNPFSVGLGGTTPTITIDAGMAWKATFAAKTVDSTHKTILITPAVTGTAFVAAAGA